jgi:glycerate kinase
MEGCPIMIPRTVLVAASLLGGALSAERAASALSRGLAAGGHPTDLCPIVPAGDRRELLDALGFDARMRSARAVVLVEARLHEDTLADSIAFEIATRARQSGVPAYAVTGENALDDFDARILDLKAILEANSAQSLEKAGRQLAELI